MTCSSGSNAGYHLRPYSAGDEGAIAGLFEEVFGHGFPLDLWHWRFLDGPAGPGVCELAWEGNRLCAHCGVTPVTMLCRGRELLAGLGGTAMTHPDYRGRGLYSLLYRRAFERMARGNMFLFYAFPDGHRSAHRLLVRDLGLADIHEVPRFSLRLGDQKPGTGGGMDGSVEELDGFDARFDRLWETVRASYEVIVRRDRLYLDWRFTRNPGAEYRTLGFVDGADLLGYVVLKTYGRDLQVVDLLTLPDTGVGMALVAKAIRLAQSEELESASMWLNPADPLHLELERLGFQPCGPVVYLVARAIGPDATDTPACDYRNWHLTMSDSDVF